MGSPSQPSSTGQWPDRGRVEKESWGEFISRPSGADPDRVDVFARPQPMDDSEKRSILQAWNRMIAPRSDNEDDEPSPMADHLRPSTPRPERAAKLARQLLELGEGVAPSAEKSLQDTYTLGQGLTESLLHYCAGDDRIDIKYANALIREIDRLKLEMAIQAEAATRQYSDVLSEKMQRITTLEAALETAQRNHKLPTEPTEPPAEFTSQQLERLAHLEREVDSLRQENRDLRHELLLKEQEQGLAQMMHPQW